MIKPPRDNQQGYNQPPHKNKMLLLLATHNQGKVREFKELFSVAPFYFAGAMAAAGDYGVAEPVETETTFMGNAALKVRASAAWLARHDQPLPDFILADDSGLSVPLLAGAPGIYSARWAVDGNGQKDFARAMGRVKTELMAKGVNEAGLSTSTVSAYFSCALALWVAPPKSMSGNGGRHGADEEGRVITVEGRCDGWLQFPPRGDRGFGYDSIFIPAEEMAVGKARRSFGQMLAGEKDAISHRQRALVALNQVCRQMGIDFFSA